MKNQRLLAGHGAIVTGSTSGIGAALAAALAGEGADVVINGLGDAAEIETARAAMESQTGARIRYHGADMTAPAEIADMVAFAKSEFGRLDILVNNAGIQHVAPIEDFPIEKWNEIIAVNLTSAFLATRLSIPIMKAQKRGRIVNIASAHALIASPFKSAYVAAKHGVLGLTRTVALEVARDGITCNAICPGYVKTPLVERQIADQAKARKMSETQVMTDVILAAQPTRRFVEFGELAGLLLYLVGDLGASVNGAALSVDGGWTAAQTAALIGERRLMAYAPFDLKGKVALVTGGNRGIGLGMADALARAGADVVVWGTSAAHNQAAEGALDVHGVRVLAQRVDVADEAAVVAAMAEAALVMGRIDTVIANAGVGGGAPSFSEMTADIWRRVMSVNLDGAFFTTREACRHMVARARAGDPGGSIAVVGSLAAIEGAARNQAYAATKGGVISMMKSIAVEHARWGIRANAILPGWIATDMTAAAQDSPAFAEKVVPRVPARRWGRPEDFGGIAVYLASDASQYHSGDSFVIDGGYSIF